MSVVLPFDEHTAYRPARAVPPSGAVVLDLDAARRARADDGRLSELQVALVRRARRLRRRSVARR